jgi:hypothetical protein
MNPVAILRAEDGFRPRRRGRPAGSTGQQAERFKHRLASLVVLGKKNVEIANALGVSAKTIGLWLRHPAVQAEIRELEADLRQRTRRQFEALFPLTIKATRKLLRDDDSRIVLQAVEMVWIALGRIPPKGARLVCDHAAPTSAHPWERSHSHPSRQPDGAHYSELMKTVRAERERMEREKAAKSAESTRPE